MCCCHETGLVFGVPHLVIHIFFPSFRKCNQDLNPGTALTPFLSVLGEIPTLDLLIVSLACYPLGRTLAHYFFDILRME